MLTIEFGSLFDSKAQTLTNTVNCVGIMGKGIALEFKKRYPSMFADYVERCNQGEVRLGAPYVYALPARQTDFFGSDEDKWPSLILNFPTKKHWRSRSRLGDIERGLDHLVNHSEAWGITSLAMPPLGCGNGGLTWDLVGPLMYRYLSPLQLPVALYPPPGTPPEQLELSFLYREASSG